MNYINHKTKRNMRKTTRNMNMNSKCIFQKVTLPPLALEAMSYTQTLSLVLYTIL